jgi:hypothetical protein
MTGNSEGSPLCSGGPRYSTSEHRRLLQFPFISQRCTILACENTRYVPLVKGRVEDVDLTLGYRPGTGPEDLVICKFRKFYKGKLTAVQIMDLCE